MTFGVSRLPTAAVCLVLSLVAAPASAQVVRTEFQQAYSRISQATAAIEPGDSASLRGYVLYPYLQAGRLGQMLRAAGSAVPPGLDEAVAAFLQANDGQPVAADLRRSWLAGLAERAQWTRFLAFHKPASDDATLRCQGFTARIETQRTQGLDVEVAKAWLTPRSLPECERAFEHLRSIGGLDDALIEQRARLALADNNASFGRQIAQQLPAGRAAPLLQWAAILENPKREIDSLIASPVHCHRTTDPARRLGAPRPRGSCGCQAAIRAADARTRVRRPGSEPVRAGARTAIVMGPRPRIARVVRARRCRGFR